MIDPGLHEVLSDGRTVWVNDSEGSCIGRFGRHIVDVHATGQAQMRGQHCLACQKRSDDLDADWLFFTSNMVDHHGVRVSDSFKPRQT